MAYLARAQEQRFFVELEAALFSALELEEPEAVVAALLELELEAPEVVVAALLELERQALEEEQQFAVVVEWVVEVPLFGRLA